MSLSLTISPRQKLKRLVAQFAPKLWVAWLNYRLPKEAELAVVAKLARPDWNAVDVGANVGFYTRVLQKRCSKVYAFEPNGELADLLRRTVARNVIVYAQALSDKAGTAELFIPQRGGKFLAGLASLDQAHLEGALQSQTVHLVRLDEVLNGPIDFIKIDVEGHELSALVGAQNLISRHRPIFLIEAEDRHRERATSSIFEFFRARNYLGFFLRGNLAVPIAEFDLTVDQDASLLKSDGARLSGERYVNNFFFTPDATAADALRAAIAQI
jgi:FkbM family methyltransferase